MTGVTLEKVNKNFGAVKVIKGVDLEIDDGEFTVFVGPSGCGKSTLLRLVAGLEDTSSGTIHIGKIDVTHVEPAERGVAMVFQSYALYPHMTVEDNMGFGLKMNGLSVEETSSRVDRAANILHLGDLLQRKPKQLSGGQRQRVAIGRAIVREPKVFLFDEPLSNLDAELRVQMRLEIAKLHQDLGATMIYVTHDQVEAMTLADKIVVLRDGYIEQVGSPLHLYRDPDNIFVAGFIGSPRMNFLEATVTAAKGETISVSLDEYSGAKFDMKLSGDIPIVGTELSVGVRPENFVDAGKVKLKTKIDVIENLGGTSYAYANSHNSEPLTIELSADHKAKEGSAFTAGFMGESAFLFDRNTKLRLR